MDQINAWFCISPAICAMFDATYSHAPVIESPIRAYGQVIGTLVGRAARRGLWRRRNATECLAGCHVDGAYSETDIVEHCSAASNRCTWRLVATDGTGREGRADEALDVYLLSIGLSFRACGTESSFGVRTLCVEIDVRVW